MGRTAAATRSRRRAGGATVEAAGGVVVRMSARWTLQVALVHRPGRDDWTLPKGKLEAGEQLEDCARREVLEETGYRCRLGRYLDSTSYRDRRNRPKTVAYWLMDVVDGEFAPNDEVDALRWVDLDDADAILTYPRDRELLARLPTVLLAGAG